MTAPPSTTLLLLSTDPAVKQLFSQQGPALHMAVQCGASVAQARQVFARSRPDGLVIDADLGAAAVLRLVRHVRNKLCNDWMPLIVLGSDAEALAELDRRLPGAIDFQLPKPLTAATLQAHHAALRRMVTLRRVSRSALDRVSEAVIVIDEKGQIRSFNGAAELLFHWAAREVIGRNVSVLVPPGHREKHPQYLRNYRRTGHARIIGVGRVEHAVRKDGTMFPMQLTVADISDGHVTRFVGVIRDLSVVQQRDELQDLIRHDTLTGLPNRAYAGEVMERSAQRWAEGGEGYSLLFCDLDGFKAINDSHGHRVGDEVLKAVAQRLRKAVSEQDFVARLAGDEFLIVLHGIHTTAAAQAIGHRVAAAVSQPVSVGELQVDARISIGAAAPQGPGQSALQVLEQADLQMYAVKRAQGKGLLRQARPLPAPSPTPATVA